MFPIVYISNTFNLTKISLDCVQFIYKVLAYYFFLQFNILPFKRVSYTFPLIPAKGGPFHKFVRTCFVVMENLTLAYGILSYLSAYKYGLFLGNIL